nr:AlkA N-terminal domain-containing protein [Bradyrhizobium sp. LMTR 3]
MRRSAAEDVSSESTGGVRILLPYRPPYDWDAMLDFLRFRAIPSVETISGDAYARAIEIEGAQGIVVVRPTNSHALEATIRFPKLSSLPAIIARLRRVFDLAADPGAIGAHLARDSALAAFVKARPGLRVPGAWDGFELAVRALLGQQITVTAGIALAGKLVAAHGKALRTRHPDFPALTHVFPQPSRIANADISKLGMPRRRAAALSSLAAAVVADPHIFGARRSLDEAIVQLRSLAGVGEWTAQYIAMRELREPDAFPAADIGLMRAMQDSAGRRPSPNELLARAERWRPWRAYAAQYLWSAKAPATVTKLRSEPGDRHRNRRKAEAEWAVDA